MNKTNYAKIVGVTLYVLAATMLLYSVYLCTSPDIWYDELFSIEFGRRPISEMIKLTAADVHPPLYYIIVHIAVTIGRMASVSPVITAKLASVVPYWILFCYSFTIVRRRHELLAGGLFSFATIAMPNMPEYTTEIRMYGWAILFITAMCIHAYPFFETDPGKMIRGLKWKKILPVFFYGLAACYTQYYAAVAAIMIYLFLAAWSLRKNVWQLGIILIGANATGVLYYPWVSAVVSQVGSISENYWIQELSWRSLGGVVKYITKAYFTNETLSTILAVIIFALLALMVLRNVKDPYMWLCFSPVIGIIIFGFAASIIIRPFFIYRYMLPGMGAMWLGIVYALSKATDSEDDRLFRRMVPVCLVALMIIIGIRDYWAFRGNELYRRVNMKETMQLFSALEKEDNLVIISNFDHVDALLAFYLNENTAYGGTEAGIENENPVPVLLYGTEPETLIKNMVPGTGSVADGAAVKKLLDEGKTVLFLGSFNSREDIVKEWQEAYGIKNENEGSFLMERYWFDVFRLSHQ